MKQSIRYIVFYFAVLVSLFLINSFNLKMLVVGIVAFAVVIIYGIECVRLKDFILLKHPSVYYEIMSKNTRTNRLIWKYVKKHCHESATSDMELLNNCRRMVICTYATITALLLLPIVLILSTLV